MADDIIFADGRRIKPGTIYCIGKNYREHANEMGEGVPESPLVFIKPGSSLVTESAAVTIPGISDNMHHEVEVVAAIGKECRNVSREDAHEYIAGYGVGVDLTLRDVQAEAKKKGRPWTMAKGFYGSAPLSKVIPAAGRHMPVLNFALSVNGEMRQQGNTGDMMFALPFLVEYLSQYFLLEEGDLVFTGTPEGVSRLIAGDKVAAFMNGDKMLEFEIK